MRSPCVRGLASSNTHGLLAGCTWSRVRGESSVSRRWGQSEALRALRERCALFVRTVGGICAVNLSLDVHNSKAQELKQIVHRRRRHPWQSPQSPHGLGFALLCDGLALTRSKTKSRVWRASILLFSAVHGGGVGASQAGRSPCAARVLLPQH
jgi:hypothetical protein